MLLLFRTILESMEMTHLVIVSDYNAIYEISCAKCLLQEFAGLFIYFCVMQQQKTPSCISRMYFKHSQNVQKYEKYKVVQI